MSTAKEEISELKTKETITQGGYAFQAIMMEGRQHGDRVGRLVRLLEEGLICYEVHISMTQSDQPDQVRWTVCMEYGNRFEVLLRPSGSSGNGTAAKQCTMSGVRLVVGKDRFYHIHHHQQEVIKRLRALLSKKINQLGFNSLFKPLRKIGKGNFGSVYMAERIEDGRKVAVKAFSKQASYSQDKGKESLVNEIEMLRKVSHPNIVELIGVFQSDNSLYMVMENLEGGHLMNKFEKNDEFSSQEIRQIISGLLKGLAHLTLRRIMHRDLKPQNLLFRRTDNSSDIVIADFGLAADVDAEQHLFVRCGTPGFVAPEVINIIDMKTRTDPVCDVFSAGVIMHMLLLGQSIFKAKTYDKILIENRMCDFKLEGTQYTKLDPRAMDLMTAMLAIDPKKRITPALALKHPYLAQKAPTALRRMNSAKNFQPLQQIQNKTTQSELRRKNSCDRTQPFRLSLDGAQSLHKKQLEMLRQMGKQNDFASLAVEQRTSIIKKKIRS